MKKPNFLKKLTSLFSGEPDKVADTKMSHVSTWLNNWKPGFCFQVRRSMRTCQPGLLRKRRPMEKVQPLTSFEIDCRIWG